MDLAGTLHSEVSGSIQITVQGNMRMTLPVQIRLPTSWKTTRVHCPGRLHPSSPGTLAMSLPGKLSLQIPGNLVMEGGNMKMNLPGVLRMTVQGTLAIGLPGTMLSAPGYDRRWCVGALENRTSSYQYHWHVLYISKIKLILFHKQWPFLTDKYLCVTIYFTTTKQCFLNMS